MSKIRSNSAWDTQAIDKFLRTTVIPISLACNNKAGAPLICSLWYLYDDEVLWCATSQSASIVKFLEHESRCAFEIAPESMPYRGVRGQGQATMVAEQGPAVLLQLIDKYLGTRETEFAAWLIGRSADEVAIRIEPDWLNSWDFSSRMSR
jgi:nitroimidazol reductase NimA-like FMN-containing flavoprotein (pyridoxamine 5'-phosphate oxidase superfamily)